jgi:hypothetical protein
VRTDGRPRIERWYNLTMNSSQFPASSIGRTTGARLQTTQDVAHPLLSPTPDSAPKYVPYTPRQRGVSPATTTGTIIHPPSPQHQQGNATSKLQLMHLKAAAQHVGLDSSTIGWAILERLGGSHDSELEVWNEIWHMVSSGKVRHPPA